jgi:hypothetical protein
MPAILPFLHGNAAFDPEATRAMSTAFDGVCRALKPIFYTSRGRTAQKPA